MGQSPLIVLDNVYSTTVASRREADTEMTRRGMSWTWVIRVVGASATSSAVIASWGNSTLAQITLDTSLGSESSSIKRNLTIKGLSSDQIEGGARRGGNLFHSFEEFNIDEGRGAYFTNPAGIKNILGRVTGNNRSDIQGTLGVLGKANLVLINPNGIIFRPNASLDVGGSFVASTADSLVFSNDFIFSAINPQALPLLTINIPIGLQHGSNPGSLVNQSIANGAGLQVQPGRTLALVGGDVAIEGGHLTADDGRIELGSFGGNSLVNLTPTNTGYALDYEGIESFQDIRLSQAAFVSTSGEGGGGIQVQGRNITLSDGSFIFADTLGSQNGDGLFIEASQLTLEDGSLVTTDVAGSGQGGDLTITTGQLLISDGAQVSATTLGRGDGGNLIVNASDSVQVIGRSADSQFPSGLFARTAGIGAAGDLTITTGQLLVSSGAEVSASTLGKGDGGDLIVNASDSVQVIGTSADGQFDSGLFTTVTRGAMGAGGDLTVETGRLIIRGGAGVSAATFGEGSAGDLAVRVSESVELIGESADGQAASRLSTSVQRGAAGDGGDLTVETGRLIIRDGAGVSANTFGKGSAGDLAVRVSESVELIGTSEDGQFPSILSTSVETSGAAGDGGNLTVETGRLIIRDGAQIFAGTYGKGDAGDLVVRASDFVELSGTLANGQAGSGLFTSVQPGATGDGGNLTIETEQLIVRDGAGVSARSLGSGKAGKLQVQAGSVRLDRQGAITATTRLGKGGNITLQARDLLLLHRNSQISTEAGIAEETPGTGGSITIDTDNLVALENSDIDANAFGGSGGRIKITAQGVFGTEAREQQTPASDITASSDLGPQFSGTVELTTPDIDPSQGIANLPIEPVNPIIAQECQAGSGPGTSRFITSGSGGVPTNPYEPLDSRDLLADVQPPAQWVKHSINATPTFPASKTTPEPILEAQGWSVNQQGDVILVAEVPRDVSQRGCRLR